MNHLKKVYTNLPIFRYQQVFDNSEPRLLLVGVDVAEGIAVTFDSYEKEKDDQGNIIRRTEYGGNSFRKANQNRIQRRYQAENM